MCPIWQVLEQVGRFNHLFLFNHFKRDTDGLADELKQVKRKLDDAYKENALLHERYEL